MTDGYFSQPIALALQPAADLMGLAYGTWNFIDWRNTFGWAAILPSVLGWSNALSAAVWWLLPDYAQFAPMLNLALNGFTAVWMWVNSTWAA